MAGFLQLSPLDWKYKTEPQGTACLGKAIMHVLIALNFAMSSNQFIKLFLTIFMT